MIETYRAHKIKTARRAKDSSGYRSLEISINGHFLDRQVYRSDSLNEVSERMHKTARGYVDDSIARPEAYTWSRGEV